MAAPTMQPVKNFAFIKCGSFMEYDCLPSYLKGQDQFIFADVPTSRPALPDGMEWSDSTDPDYPAADGWTMFIQYDDNPSGSLTDGWIETTMYIGFWNTSTNEHSAKRIQGARYTSFFSAPYSTSSATITETTIPRPYGRGDIFITDVNAEVFKGGEFKINGNQAYPFTGDDIIDLTSASSSLGATYVGGVQLGTPMFKEIPLVEDGDGYCNVIPLLLYKAEASLSLFAVDPSSTDNVGEIQECSEISSIGKIRPRDYFFASDGWDAINVQTAGEQGNDTPYSNSDERANINQGDGYEYEFAAVLTNNISITGVNVYIGSQWNPNTLAENAEFDVVSREVVKSNFCTIYRFGSWRFLDVVQAAEFSTSTGVFTNCRARGSAIFYRKRATDAGKMLKNIVMIDPFIWKASQSSPTRANRAEVNAPTERPIRLVAARVTKNYDSSATAAPTTSYNEMRFGSREEGSDSNYKILNDLITGTTTRWKKYGELDNGVKLVGSHETPNIWMSQAFKIVPGTGEKYDNYFSGWKTASVNINSSDPTYSTFSSDNIYTYGIMYTLRQFVRNSRRKTIKFIHDTNDSVQIENGIFETGVRLISGRYVIVDWYSANDPTGFIDLYVTVADSPSIIAAGFEDYATAIKCPMKLLASYTGASETGAIKERRLTYFVDGDDPTHKYCVFITSQRTHNSTDKLLLVTSDTSLVEASISVSDNQLSTELTDSSVKLHKDETVYEASYDIFFN